MIWTEYKMPLSHKRRCYTAQADVFTIATGDENELYGEILTERLGSVQPRSRVAWCIYMKDDGQIE